MADKMAEAMKTVLDIVSNAATSTTSTSKRASNDQVSKTEHKDSVRRGTTSATTKKDTTTNQETAKLKQERNGPVYQHEEKKTFICFMEERKEMKIHKTEATASTSASSSNICAGNKTKTSPKTTTTRKTDVKADKLIVMNDEMKRIKLKIEERKQLNIKKNYDNAATSSTTSTASNKTTKDNTATNKKISTRIELICPTCTCCMIQEAAFLKHMKEKHGIEKLEKNIGDYRNQECPFCGLMVKMTSYNYHIQTKHTDMFEKKMNC